MGHEIALTPATPSFGRSNDFDEFSDVPGFDVGDSVRSAQFGIGEVIDIDGMAVTVSFASGQTKKLNVEYARLEKL
jgi:DNA helicase-2/ATP-dependent DNA helicase PcrA